MYYLILFFIKYFETLHFKLSIKKFLDKIKWTINNLYQMQKSDPQVLEVNLLFPHVQEAKWIRIRRRKRRAREWKMIYYQYLINLQNLCKYNIWSNCSIQIFSRDIVKTKSFYDLLHSTIRTMRIVLLYV